MSAKRRGLGRGLDALLGAAPKPESKPAVTGSVSVGATLLEPNRFQPRSAFDESGLDDLAESIRAQGVVQPIVVTPKSGGRYTIVAGERRWRAARRAGLEEVPVVIRDIQDDQQMLELALVENVQRADLNAVEEAEAYRMLADRFQLSQEEIAGRVGKGRTTVTNALRLLRLPEEIQDFLREGRLTAGQARPLISVPDRDLQIEIAERAVSEGLAARDLEALTADLGAGKKAVKKRKKEQEQDVHTRAAVERLTQELQTKVAIVRKKRGGTIRIDFHSEEELIRLYDRLTQGKA
ncbi:MAG: ParB/RepB/Spo0J family partition protein [bacterium]|nr:ParB/RepB/Spo0J family partition protein [bacterium]